MYHWGHLPVGLCAGGMGERDNWSGRHAPARTAPTCVAPSPDCLPLESLRTLTFWRGTHGDPWGWDRTVLLGSSLRPPVRALQGHMEEISCAFPSGPPVLVPEARWRPPPLRSRKTGPSWVQHFLDSGWVQRLLGLSLGLLRPPAPAPGLCDLGCAPMVCVFGPQLSLGARSPSRQL